MLQQLIVENFIRIPFLKIEPEAPVVFFAGHNETGKSTVAEAIRFAFRGENPRLPYKRDRKSLLHHGANKGSVTVAWDNNTIKRNIKDGKVTGDSQYLPDDELVADLCFQAERYAMLDAKQRRRFTISLAGIDLSAEKLGEKLIEKGISEAVVKKYRPLLTAGITHAYNHAKRAMSDARGAWKEVTGEIYGTAKAEGWKPEQAVVQDKDEITTSLAETDAEIAKVQSDRDSDIAPITAKINEYDKVLSEPEPTACPHCGGALLIVNNEIDIFDSSGRNRKNYETLRQGALMRRAALNDQYKDKLNALHDNKRVLDEQVSRIDSAAIKEKRASELHEDAKAMARLEELLSDGPDGVASAIMAESLGPLNERLLEIASEIGWVPPVIRGDIAIYRADGHPYYLLSESAQWRIDTMLHILISELAGFPWLIFDRMDLLDMANRNKFIKWVATYGQSRTDEASILVMATLKQKPSLDSIDGIETYWLE